MLMKHEAAHQHYPKVDGKASELDLEKERILNDLQKLGYANRQENISLINQYGEKGDPEMTLNRVIQIYSYRERVSQLPEGEEKTVMTELGERGYYSHYD